MNPDAPNPLAELRDIHLAEPISAWPPAIGWWVVAALILITVCWWLLSLYRRHQARGFWRTALTSLKTQRQQPNLTGQEALQACNELLKRACIHAYPNEELASHTGEHWLSWLEQKGLTITYRESLANHWYRPTIKQEWVVAFQDQSLIWLERQSKEWRSV